MARRSDDCGTMDDMSHRVPLMVVSLCLMASHWGCSEVETALQLQFTSDSTLNTGQQILLRVDTLVLVLDAPAGFAGAPAQRARPTVS